MVAPTGDNPRPYDLTNPSEVARLYREVRGYLETWVLAELGHSGLKVGHWKSIEDAQRFAKASSISRRVLSSGQRAIVFRIARINPDGRIIRSL